MTRKKKIFIKCICYILAGCCLLIIGGAFYITGLWMWPGQTEIGSISSFSVSNDSSKVAFNFMWRRWFLITGTNMLILQCKSERQSIPKFGLFSGWSVGSVLAWNPDGSKVAFYSSMSKSEGIFVMNADGTDRRFVWGIKSGQWVPELRWHPVRNTIWILKNVSGSERKDLYELDLSKRHLRMVVSDIKPDPLPLGDSWDWIDGDGIVYTSDGVLWKSLHGIKKKLSEKDKLRIVGVCSDRKNILVRSVRPPRVLKKISIKGKGTAQILAQNVEDANFSPDKRKIALVIDTEPSKKPIEKIVDLWLMDINDKSRTLLCKDLSGWIIAVPLPNQEGAIFLQSHARLFLCLNGEVTNLFPPRSFWWSNPLEKELRLNKKMTY